MNRVEQSFLLAIVLLLVACGGGEESHTTVVSGNSGEFRTYSFDMDGPHANFFEFIDKAEIARLEETEESLVSGVGKVVDLGDAYLIENGYEGNLDRFSKTGKYLGRINRQGEGPEEYTNTQSFWVQDGLLSVYSKYKKTVKTYQLNGEFVRSATVPHNVDQIIPYQDGYAMDINHVLLEDSLMFDVFLYDDDFIEQSRLLPYAKGYEGFNMSNDDNGFKPFEDGLTYIRTMSDSLFFVKGKEARPLARLDFGNNWFENRKDVDVRMLAFTEPKEGAAKVVNNITVKLHARWMFLTCTVNGRNMESLMLDRESGEYRFMRYKIPGAQTYYVSVIKWEGDRLLASMSSDFVRTFTDYLGEERYSFLPGTTLEVIESSENPVFVWLTLKDRLPD